MRRTLRIFPLYYISLALLFFVACPALAFQPPLDWLFSHQVWFWLYAQNWAILFHGDWWPGYQFLGHFWSLAVEEQFYLVWPALLAVTKRERLLRLCTLIILTAIAIRFFLWLIDYSSAGIFVGTLSRMDSLIVGATIAIALRGEWGRRRLTKIWKPVSIGTGFFLAMLFLWTKGFLFSQPILLTIAFTVLAVFFGAILVGSLIRGSYLERLFSNTALRFMGKYSYAVYVFHLPLTFVSAGIWKEWVGASVWWQLLYLPLVIGFSILAALLSWKVIEKPFLSLKSYFPKTSAA